MKQERIAGAKHAGRAPRGRLLLVDDDPSLVPLLQWHFEREDYEVVHTPDGDEALRLAWADPPDLILLDWMIEGSSGIEVCRRLRRAPETAAVPIILVTARDGEADRICGLEAGADDYVTKPFSPRELVVRAAAVLRRIRPALAAEQLAFADLVMDIPAHKVRRSGRLVALAPTEFRLLRHFLDHPGRVFSRERLVEAIWSQDRDIDLRTVDVHIRRLRNALNAGGGKDLIRTVRAAGYALDDEG